MSLIGEAITNAEENEFIFFPETALILEKEELEPWLTNIEKQLNEKNISLLSGIIAKDPNEMDLIERFNRVRGFGPLKGHYDKVHLVPFGEYIPFKSYIGNILDFMGINLINTLPGKAFTTLSNGNIIISPSICYEIAFSDLVRKTAKISNLLVTISNDTWFGTSIGPEQHLEIAQSRALEHQKSLIRATNSGISAIITRNGKIAEKQGYFEDKELKAEIKIYEGRTPFSVVGNFLIYGYIIIIYMYLLYFKRTIVRKY
jgi:apolipoprotein N-acyltransferase